MQDGVEDDVSIRGKVDGVAKWKRDFAEEQPRPCSISASMTLATASESVNHHRGSLSPELPPFSFWWQGSLHIHRANYSCRSSRQSSPSSALHLTPSPPALLPPTQLLSRASTLRRPASSRIQMSRRMLCPFSCRVPQSSSS
jgi:hypothetical protein